MEGKMTISQRNTEKIIETSFFTGKILKKACIPFGSLVKSPVEVEDCMNRFTFLCIRTVYNILTLSFLMHTIFQSQPKMLPTS